MENQKKKCSCAEHVGINANSYCNRYDIYLCNKCEIINSNLCKLHKTVNPNKDNGEIFTGFCKEKNHNDELIFFCRNHNQLCCAACICKIKKNEIGNHKDCDACDIEAIKEEKKNKLKENIKILDDLSNSLQESIKNLKIIFEKKRENIEELKLKIQKIFTKIRSVINNRENQLLLEVDNYFNNIFFKDEIMKEIDKLPNKIKLSLEKGKEIEKNYNEGKLNIFINECLNIENNIKDIINIKESIKKYNDSTNLKIIFYPGEKECNKPLETLKTFGYIGINYFFNSSIINNNINGQNILINWIKEKINKNSIIFELIFKMSENGTSSNDFHKYCDNKGPTLTLIKTTKNKIFGGFTPLNWESKNGEYLKDESNQTFIFSINLMKKYDMISNLKSIYNYINNGPNFGCNDFSLLNNMKKGESYSNKYSIFLSNNNLELTGGKGNTESFETEELEVYKVIY